MGVLRFLCGRFSACTYNVVMSCHGHVFLRAPSIRRGKRTRYSELLRTRSKVDFFAVDAPLSYMFVVSTQ